MFSLLSLLTAVLVINGSFSAESKRLLLVQTLFRHGDRSPIYIYPKDQNKLDSWPEGLGKLTQVGRKQHYAVGKFLRAMYKDFVTSNPNEVSVTSSATERSLSSALAHLAALYAPEGRWKFEDELNWQPIPIYSLPLNIDKYLSFNSSCPRAEAEIYETIKSLQMRDDFRKHKSLMETISHYVGYNISQGMNALWLFDILLVEKIHNLPFPEWANVYWHELSEIAETTFHHIFSSPFFMRLRLGPLFQKITENMMKKITGETSDLKVYVYSAHDVNVGGALRFLNFTDVPRPPYCATLLFELHEMSDATMSMRLLYLNSTDPLKDMGKPHVLVLEDCSEFCPIEIFTQKIQPFIPNNWEQECELDASNACEIGKACEDDPRNAPKIKKEEL